MKERPILFSAPMVRAILSSTKTQTRRVCKSQPYANGFKCDGHDILCHNDYLPPSAMLMDVKRGPYRYSTSDAEGWEVECPYGVPGDRLWVREAWRTYASLDHCPPRSIESGAGIQFEAGGSSVTDKETLHGMGKYRPGMFMPRWASRLMLEITEVRVERLQDISDADSRAEGITDGGCTSCGEPEPCGCAAPAPSARDAYCHLWGQINGPDSWAANPWVWAVSFRKLA